MRSSGAHSPRRKERIRCAIYTRKSSEEGLEQEFNSLQAQREACEAFIASQRHEGWVCLATRYDDGGFSGATTDRPALQRLLADIAAGRVDTIVVYKIDRLTRSLADFAKIVEILDARGASFVSVTQQFNTTTSMGRLTLNILLSFAQFEREVIGERIRDKIAASKRKGMWMGGMPPLGYRAQDGKLLVIESEAEIVRMIFRRYAGLSSVQLLKHELDARGIKSKPWMTTSGRCVGGKPFSRGALYHVLQNRLYRGEIVHKGQAHPGEHAPIIDRPLWDAVQAQLAANTAERNSGIRRRPSLLAGMLFDDHGNRMTPTHAMKKGTRYRYYVSRPLITNDQTDSPVGLRIPAEEIEQAVTSRLRQWLVDSGSVYQVIRLADLSAKRRLIARTEEIGKHWPELPAERQRTFLTALIERIDVRANRIDIHLRPTRLGMLLGIPVIPLPSGADDKAQILSVPTELRRSGREIKMLIDGTYPFATAKPDARLIKLLIKARRFNATLVGSDGVRFAALAEREGVSPSYFTRLVRISYLAPDITQAMLDGRQPRDLTTDKLLAHSRLPLAWHEQRVVLGFDWPAETIAALPNSNSCDRLGPHHWHCGTEIWAGRDIAALRRMPPAYLRLCRPYHLPGSHTRAKTRGSRPRRALPVRD
jgi:DNA invertase Pin-like site-specific DNA recombinase